MSPAAAALTQVIPVATPSELAAARRRLTAAICTYLGVPRSQVRIPRDHLLMRWRGMALTSMECEQRERTRSAPADLTIEIAPGIIRSLLSRESAA